MQAGKGGRGGDGIGGGDDAGGVLKAHLDPAAHEHGPAEHEGTSGQGGVHNILAQAAKEHLDQQDGEGIAQNDGPVGNGHGAHEGQQHAGDAGGQIIGLAGLFQDLAVQPLEEHTGRGADQRDHQAAEAKEVDGAKQRGHQGDEHVPHDGAGGHGAVGMGGAGNRQLIKVFHLCHLDFHLLISSPARTRCG